MRVWLVEVEDLTRQGGSMGSERISHLGTRVFLSREKALAWIKKQKAYRAGLAGSAKNYFDCYSVGYGISSQKIN